MEIYIPRILITPLETLYPQYFTENQLKSEQIDLLQEAPDPANCSIYNTEIKVEDNDLLDLANGSDLFCQSKPPWTFIGRDGRSRKTATCHLCAKIYRADHLKSHTEVCQKRALRASQQQPREHKARNQEIKNKKSSNQLARVRKPKSTSTLKRTREKEDFKVVLKKISKVEEELMVKSAEKKKYRCTFCPRQVRDAALLKKHMNRCQGRTSQNFPCPHSCPAQFTNNEALLFHVALFHKYVAQYKCKYCSKDFATNYSLNRHLIRTCFPKLKHLKDLKQKM